MASLGAQTASDGRWRAINAPLTPTQNSLMI